MFDRIARGVALIALTLVWHACDAGSPAPTAADVRPVIKIGAAVSLTGAYATEGAEVRDGYVLWAERVNEVGLDVGGVVHRVELVVRDDESSPATVATVVDRLIAKDGVRFMLGPYSSVLTKAACAVTERHGVIMIQGNGSAEELFANDFKFMFGVQAPSKAYAEVALELLFARGARRIAMAYENTLFPVSVARGVRDTAKDLGMEVVGDVMFPEGVTAATVTSILGTFNSAAPDVFVCCGYTDASRLFVTTAPAVNFAPRAMLLTVGPGNPAFVAAMGKAAENLLSPTQWHRSMDFRDGVFGSAAAYADRFQRRFGRPASYQAAESTACGVVLQLALERAASLETSVVREALARLDAMTFFGPVRFDASGQNVAKKMGVTQVLGGEIELVDAAKMVFK